MNTTNTTTAADPPSALVRLLLALCTALTALCVPSLARAQTPQTPSSKSEAEHLVPPQGSAADVPVHTNTVCILSFPEKLVPKALSSSTDFEI